MKERQKIKWNVWVLHTVKHRLTEYVFNSSIEMTCSWTILDPNMAKKLGKYEKSLSFQQSKSLWKWHHPFDVT